MCLCIPDKKKKQAAVGFPPGWTFMFAEEKPYKNSKRPHIAGLSIFNPRGGTVLRSAESAVTFVPKILDFNPHAVDDFNRHIGINDAPPGGKKESSFKAASLESRKIPMTLEELLQCSCGECTNCMKDDCGRCASCLSNPIHQVCIQKVSQYLANRAEAARQTMWLTC